MLISIRRRRGMTIRSIILISITRRGRIVRTIILRIIIINKNNNNIKDANININDKKTVNNTTYKKANHNNIKTTNQSRNNNKDQNKSESNRNNKAFTLIIIKIRMMINIIRTRIIRRRRIINTSRRIQIIIRSIL